MSALTDLLSTLGPVGVFAAAFLIILGAVWRISQKVERVDSRLDSLDHHEKGRVPNVERRVDEHDEQLAEQSTALAVIQNDTRWIRAKLNGEVPETGAQSAPSRKRKVPS